MRAMKDSGIPWIGEIPEGWKVCFIKQIMRNKSIKGFPNERVLSLYRDYGVIPKDSRDDNHNVTSDDTSSYKLVDEGDFVINKMKAWQGSMAVSEYRGIISPAYYICRFTSTDINKRYIHYLLRNDSYKTEYMRLSSGLRVGQWDLNIDDFLRIMMILPPLVEQQRIAKFLDRKCAEVDEMIVLQEQIIEELKAYKQSVITEAVTKGLNPSAPMRDSGIEWIGPIPEHWEVRRIKFIGKAENGLTYTPNDVCDESEGTLVLRSSNIQNGKLAFDDNVYVRSVPDSLRVRVGDIIICSRNGSASLVGKSALVDSEIDASFGAFMMRFRSKHNHKFIHFLLTATISHYKQLFTTTTINQLTIGLINNIAMPFVENATEQKTIADYLNEKCADIDSLIQTKQSKIDSLKEYKKSIIYEYVTGKKEVE